MRKEHKAYTTAQYDIRDLNVKCSECGEISSFTKVRIYKNKIITCRHCNATNTYVLEESR